MMANYQVRISKVFHVQGAYRSHASRIAYEQFIKDTRNIGTHMPAPAGYDFEIREVDKDEEG